jgi:hypothetical protein
MSEQDLFRDEEGEPIEHTPEELPADVPEADAVEQTRPLADRPTDGTDAVEDRPEADALEQDRVDDDGDDDRR